MTMVTLTQVTSFNRISVVGTWARLINGSHAIKVKVMCIYAAPGHETSKALRHGSHSFTCKLHQARL